VRGVFDLDTDILIAASAALAMNALAAKAEPLT